MSMFLEDLERVKGQTEAALQAKAAAERELGRVAGELTREQAKCVRLEEDLGRAQEEHAKAARQAAELRAAAARLPIAEQARGAEKLRADGFAAKLETAKERLAEAAGREKTLGATIEEREQEVGRLTVELEAGRLIVEATRARVEADRVIAANVERLPA